MIEKNILIVISAILLVFLFLYEVRKWRRFLKIIRFRENLKPGIYVRYKKFGKTETGFVTRVWPERNLIQVKSAGITFNLEYHEIFP